MTAQHRLARAPVQRDGGVAARPQQSDVLHQAFHAARQVVVRQHVADVQLPLRGHAPLRQTRCIISPVQRQSILSTTKHSSWRMRMACARQALAAPDIKTLKGRSQAL